MNYTNKLIIPAALTAGLLLLSGCNSSESSSNKVVGLSIDDSVIETRSASVVKVDFSFDADDVFADNNSIAIVIRLPAGIGFRPNSGDIEQVLGDDDAVGAELFPCISGDTYVLFNLNRSDLLSANNPSDNADSRLSFTIDAVSPTNSTIDARADSEPQFSCNSEFKAQSSAAVQVI